MTLGSKSEPAIKLQHLPFHLDVGNGKAIMKTTQIKEHFLFLLFWLNQLEKLEAAKAV